MNNLSFESGAGLSLMFGPILNPSQVTGRPAYDLLAGRFQHFAIESYNTQPDSIPPITAPPPSSNPLNYYGWPGLWPVFAEFASFDPAIRPAPGMVSCKLGGAFQYNEAHMQLDRVVANYECDYNSLNLPNREAQVVKTIEPAALGYVVWKQGLWSINYWGTLHDTALPTNGIVTVTATSIPFVGKPGNQVVGKYVDPCDPTGTHLINGLPGVYLGDIGIEGWQGLLMMEEIDNKAQLILGSLLSADGASLGGMSIAAADAYAYDSPLSYFPASIAVSEVQTATSAILANKYFPKPSAFAIARRASPLASLSGRIGGYAEAFAFTDRNNSQVGGSIPFLATFDGDPFPQDDGMPNGEATLHDRALGILKIALVDLDRIHFDPSARVLVDTATVSMTVTTATVARGTSVSTVELAEAILALRNAYRSLNGSLQLYSNDTPDTLGGAGALDSAPLTGAPYSGTLEAHIIDLIRAEADFLASKLVDQSGAVANGYDLRQRAKDPSATTIEAESGAIRGLLEAYLATSDTRYRTLAATVYQDLGQRFWLEGAKSYRTTAGVDAPMRYTPIRFGLLQGALRQYYKLVASGPGHQAEGMLLLERVKRTMKLILNGWDDRNGDDRLQYPDECDGAGLELGERALTQELGHLMDMGDGDKDCVKEISHAMLPAALGAELDLGWH
jgi:hypothetical protein